jgi:hypothetical protein
VSDPVVGLSVEAEGPLVVEALVEALEYAAVPKIAVRLGAHAHLLLLLPQALLQLALEFVEQLGGHHEQPLLLERLGLYLDIVLGAEVGEDLERSGADVLVDVADYLGKPVFAG